MLQADLVNLSFLPKLLRFSPRDLGQNLKQKGIKLKFSGKLYFYYRNNILKFPIGSRGGTPLILPLKSRDLTQTIKIE